MTLVMTSTMVVETSVAITGNLYIQKLRLHDDKLYDRLLSGKVQAVECLKRQPNVIISDY